MQHHVLLINRNTHTRTYHWSCWNIFKHVSIWKIFETSCIRILLLRSIDWVVIIMHTLSITPNVANTIFDVNVCRRPWNSRKCPKWKNTRVVFCFPASKETLVKYWHWVFWNLLYKIYSDSYVDETPQEWLH